MTYEILGIGAPVVDQILLISEQQFAALNIAKGGFQIVSYKDILNLVKKSGQKPTLTAGGSASNTLKGLANLGHKCALFGKIGDDPYSKIFLKAIGSLSITSLHVTSEVPTGQVLCLVTPDGERTFCCFLGSGGQLNADELKPEIFKNARLVHIEGFTLLNPGLTERAMQYAKRAGAKVSFDLSSFEVVKAHKWHIARLLSDYVDIVFANQAETEMLTRLPAEKGCSILKDLCEIAVVFMGDKGCWLGNQEKKVFCPADPVKPVDTTGAGDLFISGFLHGYLNELPLEECARIGAITAKSVVRVLGAEIPSESWQQIRKEIALLFPNAEPNLS